LNRCRANEPVDPAEIALDRAERREHLRAVGDVEASGRNPWHIAQSRHGRLVDVADDDARPGLGSRARQRPTDAVAAAGDDDHISLGFEARPHGQETFAASSDGSKSTRPTRVAVSARLFMVWASRRQTLALPCRVAQTSSPGA
jgi:hypothetical protein